ncbi:MAG: hypothetical protein U0163_20695 [Gemmatimonadaceae bacterium]
MSSSPDRADFVRIMTEPENALTKQYTALVEADGAALSFRLTAWPKSPAWRPSPTSGWRTSAPVGAHRDDHLEDVLYTLPDKTVSQVVVDAGMVQERLTSILEDEDLRKYIL